MALTPFIRTTQARVLSVESGTDLRVTMGRVYSIINYPTPFVRLTQGRVIAITAGTKLRVTQARVMAVVRGRVADPRVHAWTFTLDGHDFYVLRLGDELTLVYDVYSEQWMDWHDKYNPFWRLNIGTNWVGAAKLAYTYGSSVIVGDDTAGLLYFLDPEQPYDDHPDYLDPVQELYFERVTQGQVPMTGRQVLPCYAAWLTTDMGDPAYVGAGVKLEISDDAGETYDDMGTVTVTPGENSPELSWYSLGQIEAPGRLFRITDDGAVARIDSMEMNDPDDADNA
jgi:hypothetical protein